jgi:hypothetical protein
LQRLWRRYRNPVRRNDLGLIGKDVAALRIDQHQEPLHIVVKIRGIVTERLNPREILAVNAKFWLFISAIMFGTPTLA